DRHLPAYGSARRPSGATGERRSRTAGGADPLGEVRRPRRHLGQLRDREPAELERLGEVRRLEAIDTHEVDAGEKASESRFVERPSLHAELGTLAEGTAVRLLADEREPRGAQLAGDALEPLRRAGEVGASQVTRAGRRAVRGVRHADPLVEQRELLLRLVEARGQFGRVEEPPEVVA